MYCCFSVHTMQYKVVLFKPRFWLTALSAASSSMAWLAAVLKSKVSWEGDTRLMAMGNGLETSCWMMWRIRSSVVGSDEGEERRPRPSPKPKPKPRQAMMKRSRAMSFNSRFMLHASGPSCWTVEGRHEGDIDKILLLQVKYPESVCPCCSVTHTCDAHHINMYMTFVKDRWTGWPGCPVWTSWPGCPGL